MGLIGGAISAVRSFVERIFTADPANSRGNLATDFESWDRWESRSLRYSINWAFYQNQAYRDKVHNWSARFKAVYGCYKHIRHVLSPSYTIGEFFAGRLMGGPLDLEAGDGKAKPSALPIVTKNEALRPAIARLWRDSRWQVNKETYTRFGAVLGDVGLRVVDDTVKGQVRLEVVHPAHVRWCSRDPQGNVRDYIIEKYMRDPRVAPGLPTDESTTVAPVVYRETAWREPGDSENVHYQTTLDGEPYDWGNGQSQWTEPYGFTPLVIAHHECIGLEWGQNAFHAGLSRFIEVDGLASTMTDQGMKELFAPMLIAGVPQRTELAYPGRNRAVQTAEQNYANPEPLRTEKNFLYHNDPKVQVHSLTEKMDYAALTEHLTNLQGNIEKLFPELLADTGNLTGTVTAEAVRNARSLASSKVQAKRPGYDGPLVKAQQMAIAIGGMRGYDGYQGFGLDSYEAGDLDHEIGARPVFEVDPMDKVALDQATWTAIGAEVKVGVPLELALRRNGWTDQDMAEFKVAKAAEPPPPAPVVVAPAAKPQPQPQPQSAGEPK